MTLLPKDGKVLAKLMLAHVEGERAKMAFRYLKWSLAWYILNGFRRFTHINPVTGSLVASFYTKDNQVEFQSQEILRLIDQVVARLAAMDLRPLAMRKGLSITSVRSRALAQIIADHLIAQDQLDATNTLMAHYLTTLGSVGRIVHISEHPVMGLVGDIEVIHPGEIYPFPSIGQDLTKVRGMVWSHYVPLHRLVEVHGKKIRSHLSEMQVIRRRPDTGVPEAHSEQHTETSAIETASEPTMAELTDDESAWVLVHEVWIDGPRGTCREYAATSGCYTIVHQDFEGLEVYCPIGFDRFMENGSFHGAGLFDVLFSLHREYERLMKQLFNNIRDIDQYGITVIPRGQVPADPQLRDIGKGLKVLMVDADPVMQQFNPIHIAPFNSGDVPGKTAAFARDILLQSTPIRDLIEEKGRVESAAGLRTLDEVLSQLMATPVKAMASIYGRSYREAVRSALGKLPGRAIPVSNLSLDLLGAVVNVEDHTVSFDQNPLPTMSQLSWTVREAVPRSETARVQQAIELTTNGFMDPQEFRLYALKENLDVAMWMEEDRAAYESVVLDSLMLFGNGTENQQVVVTPDIVKPELQLRVVGSVMASPLMRVADPDIIDDFQNYKADLREFAGFVTSANPDDAAAVAGLLKQQTAAAMKGENDMARMQGTPR
jgi:hypothetical protein